jgi:hypothetical protein
MVLSSVKKHLYPATKIAMMINADQILLNAMNDKLWQ